MARSFGNNGAFAREESARSARNYRAIARKESVGSARNNGAIARQESARNEMKWFDLHAFLLNFWVTYPYWAV